jgi:hypothetical protein
LKLTQNSYLKSRKKWNLNQTTTTMIKVAQMTAMKLKLSVNGD